MKKVFNLCHITRLLLKIKNIFVVVVATLLGLFFADRFLYYYIGDIQLSNYAEPDGLRKADEFTPKLNSLGFRQEPMPPSVDNKNTYKLLFLGDSFTFGYRIPDGNNRFSKIVENSLNENGSEFGGGWETFITYNAGVNGTAPIDWVEYLKDIYPTYSPNRVLAIFFLRDGTNMGTSLAGHIEKIEELLRPFRRNLFFYKTGIGRAIAHFQVKKSFNIYYGNIVKDAYLGDSKSTAVWNLQKRALIEISQFCNERGIAFSLIIFPLLFDLKDYQYQDVEDEITSFAKQNMIDVYSLIESFRGLDERELWISPLDQHPNERANEIAATGLLRKLEEDLKRYR